MDGIVLTVLQLGERQLSTSSLGSAELLNARRFVKPIHDSTRALRTQGLTLFLVTL